MNTSQKFSMKTTLNKIGKNSLLLAVLLVFAFFAAFLLCVFIGVSNVSVSDALKALFGLDSSSSAYRIIVHVRLPRALAAALSGMALAVSGVIIQAVLNNALASPNIIGVNAGAGLAVVALVSLFPSALSVAPFAAFFGALLTTSLIYLIASRTGAGRVTIALIGVAVNSSLTACMNAFKTIFPETLYNANSFLMGGISGVSLQKLNPAWIIIVIFCAVAFVLGKDIDVLALGEHTAQSLGMNVRMMRMILIVVASALAGAAVSFAGLLSFVGLIVPHIARRFSHGSHRTLIFYSAFGGACFVMICDILSRILFAPYEIPVGIIMSFVGAPFFIYLILKKRRGRIYD